MKFSEVLDALMEGKPITRAAWEDKYMYYDKEENCFVLVRYPDDIESRYEVWSLALDLYPNDLIADDWDIDYWDTEDIVDDNKKVDEE
jgi:hypothetical protein